MPSRSSPTAAATAARPTATAAATPTTANALTKQTSLHVAQRLQFLNGGIGLLLLIFDRTHTFVDLHLQDRGKLLDARRAGTALGDVFQQLQRTLVVLRVLGQGIE